MVRFSDSNPKAFAPEPGLEPEPLQPSKSEIRRERQSPLRGWLLWGLGAIAIALTPILWPLLASALGLAPDIRLINWGGRTQLWQFLSAAAHPDLSWELLSTVGPATLITLAYAVCGSTLSLILGSFGGLLCSEVGGSLWPGGGVGQPLWLGLRGLLAVPRAIHELVWGLLLINLWGTDPLTGIVAIALPFGAATAKIFSEILDDTPREAWRSLQNSGASPLSAFCYGLLPLSFLNLTSYAFYRFECSLRSAAVLGMIGVGGLGTEIHVSLQSLRYEQLWTFFYALIFLNGWVDWASARSRQRLGCTTRLEINRPSAVPTKTNSGRHSEIKQQLYPLSFLASFLRSALLLLMPLACFVYLQPNFSLLFSARTATRLRAFAQEFWPLDWALVPQLPPLVFQTLAMSVVAIALASFGSTLLSFPAAHTLFLPSGLFNPTPRSPRSVLAFLHTRLLPRLTYGLSRALLLLGRAIPAPVWALVLLYVLFPGLLPGAIALALHNLGILGRLQAEVIENLEPAPLNALQGQGIAPSLVFCYGVLPLTLPPFLAYGLYRWEVCLRETLIVGLVGAGGLGYVMTEQFSSFDYGGLAMTLLCFLGLTFAVDCLSSKLRQQLRNPAA